MQEYRAIGHREHRHQEGHGQRTLRSGPGDEPEEQDVGKAGAENPQRQQREPGLQAGHLRGPQPQGRQHQEQRGPDLAARGGGQRGRALQVAPGGAGRHPVTEAGAQAGQHGPQRMHVAAGLQPCRAARQQGHPGKADHQSGQARAIGPLAEPGPGHQRAEHGHGGVQHRRQAAVDVDQREGEQGKRQAGVEHPDGQGRLPEASQLTRLPTPEQQRQQEQRGHRHPQRGRGQGAELACTDAHEQEGRAPQRAQQQQVPEPGRCLFRNLHCTRTRLQRFLTHGCTLRPAACPAMQERACWGRPGAALTAATPSRASSRTLRSSPPA